MDFGNLKLGIKKKSEINPLLNNASNEASPLRELDLSLIECDPSQPRREVDPAKLEELAQDIKQHGLLQPIIVRPNPNKEGHFIIIAGERRFRACQELSLPTIQSLVRDDAKLAELGYWQMAENMKREDLKFYEIAEFIAAKVQAGEKKGAIAQNLGMRSDIVSQYVAWQDAPQWLKDLKDRIPSVRIFYDFVKEADQHSDDLQSFIRALPDDETLNNVTLRDFRASLEQNTFPPLANDNEEPNDAAPTLLQNVDSDEPEDETTGDASANDDGVILPYSKNQDAETALSEDDGDTAESSEPEFGFADDQTAELDDETLDFSESQHAEPETAADEPAEESTTDDTELNFDDALDLSPTEAASPDLKMDDAETEQLKHPLILGHVDSREAELLYKQHPASEGFVWVKFEDGTVESVLAERFELNRIVEG